MKLQTENSLHNSGATRNRRRRVRAGGAELRRSRTWARRPAYLGHRRAGQRLGLQSAVMQRDRRPGQAERQGQGVRGPRAGSGRRHAPSAQRQHIWFTVATSGVVEFDPADPENRDGARHRRDRRRARRSPTGPSGKLYAVSDDQLISFKPNNPAGFDAGRSTAWARATSPRRAASCSPSTSRGQRISPLDARADDATSSATTSAAARSRRQRRPQRQRAYANPGTDPQTVGRINADGPAEDDQGPDDRPVRHRFMPDGKYWFASSPRIASAPLSQNGKVKHGQRPRPEQLGPALHRQGQDGMLFVGLENIGQGRDHQGRQLAHRLGPLDSDPKLAAVDPHRSAAVASVVGHRGRQGLAGHVVLVGAGGLDEHRRRRRAPSEIRSVTSSPASLRAACTACTISRASPSRRSSSSSSSASATARPGLGLHLVALERLHHQGHVLGLERRARGRRR